MATSMISEADILAKVVAPMEANLSPETAHMLLRLKLDAQSKKEVRALLRKNNRGTISGDERIILEKYLRVGSLIDLLHAKARLSLQRGQ